MLKECLERVEKIWFLRGAAAARPPAAIPCTPAAKLPAASSCYSDHKTTRAIACFTDEPGQEVKADKLGL